MFPASFKWLFVSSFVVRVVSQTPFDPLQHSGPASPYFDAPSREGISSNTPSGCTVDQAAYILRHGSRYPEPGSFQGWQTLFTKFQNATYTARGPLRFIPSWTPPIDDEPHQPLFLSSTGAKEAFELGVELRNLYGFTKGGDNFTVWAAAQQRVFDTASYFLRGYLSQGNYLNNPQLNRGSIISLPDSVNDTFANSLTPSSSCPTYNAGNTGSITSDLFRSTYQDGIARRLNKFLVGLTLTASDIGIMQDLCGFSAEINGDTRFCDIFEEEEWLDYEYAHDLNYYYGSGPGNPLSATTGFPWVQEIARLFVGGPNISQVDKSGNLIPPPLIMGFTHDNNLPPVLSALGLWNTSATSPLSLTTPNSRRSFRSSYVVAFRGYIALEKLTCERELLSDEPAVHTSNVLGSLGSGNDHNETQLGSFVRVRVDKAPVTIPGCNSGPGSSCPIDDFMTHLERRGVIAGDFVERCGLQGVKDATSLVTFLTTQPPPNSIQLVGI
ncbi:phosphoglycerate mutase-like protein [Collybia nuda]|uniref:Phosphoglycerate mutase-like protein n=1 Tax=Collybia nuda TaxID=64659 RepID=A0A9P6CJB2_9AGAR|nr:phosphoglycerate mutase-like protein [Collybia nuda]